LAKTSVTASVRQDPSAESRRRFSSSTHRTTAFTGRVPSLELERQRSSSAKRPLTVPLACTGRVLLAEPRRQHNSSAKRSLTVPLAPVLSTEARSLSRSPSIMSARSASDLRHFACHHGAAPSIDGNDAGLAGRRGSEVCSSRAASQCGISRWTQRGSDDPQRSARTSAQPAPQPQPARSSCPSGHSVDRASSCDVVALITKRLAVQFLDSLGRELSEGVDRSWSVQQPGNARCTSTAKCHRSSTREAYSLKELTIPCGPELSTATRSKRRVCSVSVGSAERSVQDSCSMRRHLMSPRARSASLQPKQEVGISASAPPRATEWALPGNDAAQEAPDEDFFCEGEIRSPLATSAAPAVVQRLAVGGSVVSVAVGAARPGAAIKTQAAELARQQALQTFAEEQSAERRRLCVFRRPG